MTWIIILAWYLLIGVVSSTYASYLSWREGFDFTLSDFLPWFWRMLLWPVAVVIMLEDVSGRSIGDIVLIPGSRAAKLMKKLRED